MRGPASARDPGGGASTTIRRVNRPVLTWPISVLVLATEAAAAGRASAVVRPVRHDPLVPRISEFYGIVIYMYRPDHPPPHFHAQYGEHIAQIRLDTFEVLNGSLPPRALRLVRDWAALHPVELAENWELAQALEPLAQIDPLP
jgi:hypothetical protein